MSEKTEHRKSSGLGPYGGNIVNNTPTNIFEKSKVRKYHSETQEKKRKTCCRLNLWIEALEEQKRETEVRSREPHL